MNSEMGFSLRTPASDGACLRDDPRGAMPLGRIFAPHTSHEGNWCQASIGLRHGTCCRLIWGLRASPRLFFSQSISITYRCGPCGVVGDALASSKRSGKSTGFCLATDTAAGETMRPRRATRR